MSTTESTAVVVGAGLMGEWHAHALRSLGVRLLGVADRDERRAAALARRYRTRAATDIGTLLAEGPRAVHLCTPVRTHRTLATLAVEAGAGVLIEKPFALTAGDAEAILGAAAALGLIVCPVHQFRFQPGVVRAGRRLPGLGAALHFDLTACSAGARTRSDERDRIAWEILPHGLDLVQLFQGGAVDGIPWQASAGPPGEWRFVGATERITVSLLVSLSGRPTRNTFRILAERGSVHLDLFHGFAVEERGGVSRARKIEKKDHPTLFNVVEEMTIASGLPRVPDVYIIDDPSPNAFATGRDPQTSVVAVTSGLLEVLDRDELQGVVAHEIGHIRNRDILYMTMVGVMLGAIILLADVGRRHLFWGGRTSSRRSSRDGGKIEVVVMIVAVVLIILSPILAQLIFMAISRKREYLADASSAQFTRYPEGLASALEKLSRPVQKLKVANPATAGMYIVNPLKITGKRLADLTSTHPPLSERVRILRAMGGGAAFGDYNEAFRKVTGRPVGVVPTGSAQAAEARSVRSPTPDSLSHIERVRETTDAFWSLDDFIFLSCACGTKLKVPPSFEGKRIDCPHCGTSHSVVRSDEGR